MSELKAGGRFPEPARVMTVTEREAAVLAGEQAADQRENTADERQSAADQRQEAADQRQDTAEQRQETADQRENTADQRQDIADRRQTAADLRQETADLRQEAADLRQKAVDQREADAQARAELSAVTEAQLREANERLVVASVRAQTMTEVAEQATARMSYMAEHDFLTGLPNRALLTDRLAQAIAFAQRHGRKVALMYLDLDHFKHINDSLGHPVGDQLLQSAARRLQTCLRVSDTVSRHGGDEFVVLLAEVDQVQDACLTAEKLIKSMTEPHLIDGHQLYVTLSIGISLFPDDGKDVEAVIRNADTAMYHAKRSGRNTYQRFTPDMNARAMARQSIEEALRQALEKQELVLHYQPKVNLDSGAITGAEALVRWRRPGRPLVYPAEFVRIAEDCGLILPLGKWVLREACRQSAEWMRAGLDIRQIAVNVSAVEFLCKDFLPGVHAVLNDTGLDPRFLELELTESVLMQDTDRTKAILHALKDIGVQIAIDDFGTGYSSLSYLRRFPIDTLKIDQSFVQDIDGYVGESIVSAVIAMGMSLGQRVVAEGIETSRQLAFLKSRHCAEGQGFYFSRPVAAGEYAALLSRDRPQPVAS